MKSTRAKGMALKKELLIAQARLRTAVMAGELSGYGQQIEKLKRQLRRLQNEGRQV
jgi:hypothetical protein